MLTGLSQRETHRSFLFVLVTLQLACNAVNFEPNLVQDNPGGFVQTPEPPKPPEPPEPPIVVVETKQQSFFQNDESKVDVLFIDDNSASMVAEQKKMGQKFNNFIEGLAQVNWQIGITTTDTSSGPHGLKGKLLPITGLARNFIKKEDSDAEAHFLNTIVRSETIDCDSSFGDTCPSGDEKPLAATIMAIGRHDKANLGFFREGADLAVVILSDEDESITNEEEESDRTHGEQVIEAFKNIWGNAKNIRGYGIIVQPGDQNCYEDQIDSTASYGVFINHFVHLTGGITGSICDSSYGNSLKAIGDDVQDMVLSFKLNDEPLPNTVKVNTVPEGNYSWRIEGKDLIFATAPKPGTKIDVTYDVPKP